MEKQWKQYETLNLWAPKITADGGYSHEIKRRLLLGRKIMTSRDSILKSRGITLPKRSVSLRLRFFQWSYSWTIKKAECQRTDAFELRCWRRPMRVPWTARRSNQYPKWNQSWIFIGMINVEGETPLIWPPDVKNWLIGKDLDSGKDWRARRRGWQRMRWLDLTNSPIQWTWVLACSESWWWTGKPGVLQFMGSQWLGHNWVTELNWKLMFQAFMNEMICK